MSTFPCLGIAALGQCSYDPGNPTNLYFSIGEVVAALSITLIIPQFLKPIYRFRLRAQSVSYVHIYGAVFLGSIFVLIGSAIPHVGLAGMTPLGFPIIWEFMAGCFFILAFGALAWATLRPATARRKRFEGFTWAAADFLAHATDADRADFSRDLLHNMGRLGTAAQWATGGRHQTAFFDFIHRHDIRDGAYAFSLLRLVAEPRFCDALVSARPWDTAALLHVLSANQVVSEAGSDFIQQIGRQAIVSPTSMMLREMDYTGFGVAPALSNSLFDDPFIGRHYHPLRGLRYDDFSQVDGRMMKRFFHALDATLKNVLKMHDYWGDQSLTSTAEHLQWIAADVRRQTRADPHKHYPLIELQFGTHWPHQGNAEALGRSRPS